MCYAASRNVGMRHVSERGCLYATGGSERHAAVLRGDGRSERGGGCLLAWSVDEPGDVRGTDGGGGGARLPRHRVRLARPGAQRGGRGRGGIWHGRTGGGCVAAPTLAWSDIMPLDRPLDGRHGGVPALLRAPRAIPLAHSAGYLGRRGAA